MDRLKGKVAVITGGAGVIGRAAVARFVEEGAQVLIADHNGPALQATVDAIRHDNISSQVTNVISAEDNYSLFKTAADLYGGVDIFLANAGIEGAVGPIEDAEDDMFDQVMAVNVKGVWLGLKAAIPALKARGGGSIVITSSHSGVKAGPRIAPYVTSKHAVIGLMRSAATECAPFNIRVNTVNPAPVNSDMVDRIEEGISPGAPEKARERIKNTIPLGRYANPDEVVNVMLFLASDEASFVTGGIHMIDGAASAR